jgi:hypothetical protein
MLPAQFGALALATIALAASGCGGSSKSQSIANSTTTTGAQSTTTAQITTAQATTATAQKIKIRSGKPLTHAVWVARGDAICARTVAKLSSTSAKTQQDFLRGLSQAIGYERTEAKELSNLVPPVGKANDWAQYITGLEQFSAYSARAREYARANKFKEAGPILAAASAIKRQLVAIGKRNGFTACAD